MKALFTSFHMLYCLSQNSKYVLRYGRAAPETTPLWRLFLIKLSLSLSLSLRMTIAVWELSLGQFPPPGSQCRSSRSDNSATRATIHKRIGVYKSSFLGLSQTLVRL